MLKNIAALIKVKTLITLPIVGATIYGFVAGLIEPKDFVMIALLVIGFYFQKKDTGIGE